MAQDMSSKKRPRYSLEPDLDVVVEDATFPVHSLHLMTASPGFSTTSCCNHLQPVVVGSGFTIADIFTEAAQLRNTTPVTVLVISGHSGCRGTCFKDKDHCQNPESAMHLTDFCYSFPESSSGESIVQTASSPLWHLQPILRRQCLAALRVAV